MSEYHEYYLKFHQERLKSMGLQKPRSCKGCKEHLDFVAKENTLTLTCGSKGNGKCGEQFTVTLPEYARYSRESQGMVNAINGSHYEDDPHDLSRYPLQAMSKITTLSKEETEALSEQSDLIETAHKDLKEIKNLYEKGNDISDYAKRVQELHGLRREVQRKRLRLMAQITKETDGAKRKDLQQDYAKASLIVADIYPLIASLKEPWSDYVTIQKGSVTKKNDAYLDQEKPKKAPKDPKKAPKEPKKAPKEPKKAPKEPKEKPQKPDEDPQEPVAGEPMDCSKFKTNKGKRCPECCSGHPERCMWVPKEGCRPK